jgi:general stress protein CsbA
MRRIDLRNAILCAAAVIVAFLIVNPFVEMSFDDDFSYAWTVHQLLETGRITFNGWAAPVLITHALWGALFSKIFGYSFTVLRFSTLPMAAGSAFITYYLARNAGLTARAAVLATLTLCLGPCFLPLADSFMTDIPALFYMLASLYALTRSAQAPALRPSLAWLFAGVLAGIIGGMGRQTVWGVPLCIIPYLIIIRHHDFRFVLAAIGGWLAVLLDAYLAMHWFAQQPWAYLDPSLPQYLRMTWDQPFNSLSALMEVSFTTVMFALPALLPFIIDSLARFWRERKTWRGAVTAIVILLLSIAASQHPKYVMPPWLFNIVGDRGVLGTLEISGARLTTFPLAARGIVSGLVLITCYLLVARCAEAVCEPHRVFSPIKKFFQSPNAGATLVIFGIAYAGLLVIRSAHDLVFDRYCLPLVPCLAIPLLRGRKLTIAWPALGIFILYTLALTQDNLALAKARQTATDLLKSHGVPRTQIAAGLEYNFYTQLEEQGHINRSGIGNPPHNFNDYAGYTPAIVARYRLEYPRMGDMVSSPYGSIDYISWLPPFHRRILIDEFANPWWLDTTRPHSQPNPIDFEVNYEMH